MPVYIVAGLGFGDEGKGSIVDLLAERFKTRTVYRFNGGAQAAHNVIRNNIHHTFSQFGSGSLMGAGTRLTYGVLVDPAVMLAEAKALKGKTTLNRISVEVSCSIVTRFHKALGRLESLAAGAFNTTGMGLWQVIRLNRSISYRAYDIFEDRNLQLRLRAIQQTALDEAKKLTPVVSDRWKLEMSILNNPRVADTEADIHQTWAKTVNLCISIMDTMPGDIFEGAQGFLLDHKHGFPPFTTATSSDLQNVNTGGATGVRIGVIRSYYTRHGDGPFPSERLLTGRIFDAPELHNKREEFAGAFRIGGLDLPNLIRAIRTMNIQLLAVNHMDVAERNGGVPVRISEHCSMNVPAHHLLGLIEEVTGIKVAIAGYGPAAKDKKILCPDLL